MKLHRSILTAAALLAFTGNAAFGLTVPVLQDSTATNGKFLKGAGSAATLSVSSKQAAYVQFSFDSATIPIAIKPGNIVSATLRIYVGKAKVPGALELHTITDSWSEGLTGTAPTFDSVAFAGIPVEAVATKDFVSVDVTDYVKFALQNSDAGIAITAAGTTKVTLGSKEGPASGYPCELNIETNYADDGSGNSTFNTINGTTLNVTEVNTGLFHADGPNGSFHMDASTGTFNNTTLVGSFEGLNGNAPQIRFSEVGGNTFTDIGRDANQNFVIETADIARLAITNGGNIGIGTSNPKHKLDVNGNLWFGTQQEGAVFTELGDTLYIGSQRKYLSNTLGATVNGKIDWVNLMAHPLSAGILFGLSGPSDSNPHSAPTPLMAVQSNGNVGIGTGNSAAAAKLDVRGDVKLGSTGQFFAPGGEENLRIIRGFIVNTATIGKGSGFTVARKGGAPVGHYVITFTTPFTDLPVVTVSPNAGVGNVTAVLPAFATDSFEVQVYVGGALTDANFNFIAVGPR